MTSEYRIDLARIMEDLGEAITVSADVDLGDFELDTQRFVSPGPARVEMTLTNTGAGVVGQGAVTISLDTECARCLKPFTLPLDVDVDAFYVVEERSHDLPEEQEFELIVDRSIDLMPALRSAIMLELPFAPLHDADCAGICPICGTDLNVSECECEPEVSESPFAALSGMFDSDDEKS